MIPPTAGSVEERPARDGVVPGSIPGLAFSFSSYKNTDKHGNPSNKVLAVTNHHVVCKVDDRLYDFRSHGSSRQQVRVCGSCRFQRGLDEIKAPSLPTAMWPTPASVPKRLPSWRPTGTRLKPKPLTRLDGNWKSIERPSASSGASTRMPTPVGMTSYWRA